MTYNFLDKLWSKSRSKLNSSSSLTQTFLSKKWKIYRTTLVFCIISSVYLVTYLLIYRTKTNITDLLSNTKFIPIYDSHSHQNGLNYTEKLHELVQSEFNQPAKHTSTYTNKKSALNKLLNSNTMYQDDRLTMGVVFQYLLNNKNTNKIPFNWIDWVDLSYLNSQLEKPHEARLKCSDIINELNFVRPSHRKLAQELARPFGCVNSKDLTQEEIEAMGFTSVDQLPGFIQFQHSFVTSSEYIRNLQGKSYLMTHQPMPYKVIFLNDHGDDLVLDVEKGRIRDHLDDYQGEIDPMMLFDQLTQEKNKVKTYEYHPQPVMELSPELFQYDRRVLAQKVKELKSLPQSLDKLQQSYMDSMMASINVSPGTKPETRYFKEATLRLNNGNHDNGWHYDWRFFNGKLVDTHRTAIIMERLLRNWFKFTTKYDIISWIAHGPLLSWYWNGGIFPFDHDLDIQMPIIHLLKLGEMYNQTIVVEDVHEGFGKYMIEVGTFVHNRLISKRGNHIDARFIDIETGVYIDITGISTSAATPPLQYYQNLQDDIDEGAVLQKEKITYNDRRVHFYHHDHISPIKLSMLNGVPCYIPNAIIKRLKYEYPRGALTKMEYDNWYFVPRIQNWIPFVDLQQILDANDYMKDNGRLNKIKFQRLVSNITDEEVWQLAEVLGADGHGAMTRKNQVLIDYYHMLQNSHFHQQEKQYLFSIDPTKHKNVNDLEEGKIGDDTTRSTSEEYKRFVAQNVKLAQPIRESLFEHERVNGGIKDFYERAAKALNSIEVKQIVKFDTKS